MSITHSLEIAEKGHVRTWEESLEMKGTYSLECTESRTCQGMEGKDSSE
jgi:hypothetical protein